MIPVTHPARHYIYFLISRRIFHVEGIVKELEEIGIPAPTKEFGDLEAFTKQVLSARAGMKFPAVFNPRDVTPNADTVAFMKYWKITEAWRGSQFIAAATELLYRKAERFAVELMLLGPLSATAIANRVAKRYGMSQEIMNPGVVRAYAHYYWDPHSMTASQWKSYISTFCTDQADYQTVLQAPRSSAGAALSIYLADRDPQLLGTVERYEAACSASFKLFMETVTAGPSAGRNYAAFAALNMMRLADSELDKYRGGGSELVREFERLEALADTSRPMSVLQANFMKHVIETSGSEVSDGVPE